MNVFIKNLLNKFKRHRNSLQKPLEHVYTDKFGNRYYQLKEISQISYRRSIAAEIATRQAEFNLTKDDMKKIIASMKTMANEGNIVDMFALLSEVEQRMDYAGEEETLLHLASVYFFNETEDIDEYLVPEQTAKIDLWRQDPHAKTFFLHRAFERTRAYTNISDSDIQLSLMIAREGQRKLQSILDTQSLIISTN